jgi:glutaredoxin
MEIKIGGKALLIIIILIVVGIVGFSVSGYFVKNDNGLSDLDKFAKCLSEKGATVYVSQYCGHCKNQKEMFGDSLKYVNSVECTENQQLCQEKGITGVPTWIINGLPYAGVQSFERLSELTGCPLS